MTMTGDEVRERIRFDPLTGHLVEDIVDILADLADTLDDFVQHRNAFVIMLDNKIQAEAKGLADKVTRLEEDSEARSKMHHDLEERFTRFALSEAIFAKRIAALEQKVGAEPVDLGEPPPVSPLPIVGRVMGTFVATEEDSDA